MFNSPIKRKIAEDNLSLAKKILDSLSVPFFLSNGTLLGCIRENGLIKHDLDVDIGVLIENFNGHIYSSFIDNGFEKYDIYGAKERGLQYSFKRDGIKLDIFFYYPEPYGHSMSVWKYGEQIKYKFPKLDTFIDRAFLGETYKVPSNYEEYLSAQYGDWKTPVKEWDWASSPKNI